MVNAYEALKLANGGLPPSGGDFTGQSLNTTTRPADAPPGVKFVGIDDSGAPINLRPGDLFGVAFNPGYDLAQLQITLDGQAVDIQQVAQDYVIGKVPQGLSPGLKELIFFLTGESFSLEDAIEILALPLLHEHQELSTHGATGLDSFSANGTTYLAVANYFNGTTYNNPVTIYNWDGNQFNLYQSIASNGPYDVEFFQIDGTQYLAVANSYNNTSTNVLSRIYRWNGSQFVLFQSIPTKGAKDWEHFTIGSDHYLAVANFTTTTFFNTSTTSEIYKWNGSQFVSIQSIATIGAWKWEHVEVEGQHFLALASYINANNLSQTSRIYRWNGSQFVSYQSFESYGAVSWEAFQVGGEQFLGLVNFGTGSSDTSSEAVTQLLRWDGNTFVSYQEIEAPGNQGLTAFSKDGQDYLFMAGTGLGEGLPSVVYRWNGSEYVLHQALDTEVAPYVWEVMEINGETVLVAASRHKTPSAGYNDTTLVFTFE